MRAIDMRSGIKRMVILVFTLVFLSACTQSSIPDADIFHIAVLDVGNADAIVLMTENHTVLIDTGLNKSSAILLDYLNEYNVNSIDYMILTHFDKDHIGAADSVIETFAVKNIVQPDYIETSKQYKQYEEALSLAAIKPLTLKEELRFVLDTVEFIVYPPEKAAYQLDNDYSIAVSAQHGQNSFLFTGDAEAERLEELLQRGHLEHIFLKVPHHGVYDEKSEEFFNAVGAKYAVITESKKKPASDEVLFLLDKAGTEIYCTQNGNIYCKSDGISLSVWQ